MSKGERRWIISGGIGSGKSAVRRLLDEWGFFTVDADSVGHEVLSCGGAAYRDVAMRWPEAVDEEGVIDRAELGRIVFSDEDALDELESLTHPHIFGIISDRVQGIPDSAVVEIPLLHHGLGGDWERVIVDCADDLRLHRLVTRGVDEDHARARMKAQPSRSEWLSSADIVIPNHGDMDDLEVAVSQLLKKN